MWTAVALTGAMMAFKKTAMIYYCMYACVPLRKDKFLTPCPPPQDCHFFLNFFSNRTSNRFQRAERLKSMDKKTLLAFLNRKGYKNKHALDVSTYIHVCTVPVRTYVRTRTTMYVHNTYHVFPWKVLPGKRLQGRSGLKRKKKNHEPASLAFLD